MVPCCDLFACCSNYPLADRYDEAGLFEDGHKLRGRRERPCWFSPTQQCLTPGELSRLNVSLDLEVQREFIIFKCTAQHSLDDPLPCRLSIHVGRVECVTVLP